MQTAPIILFTYNRLYQTKKTIEALQGNELASESDLIIYSDGAKPGKEVQVACLRRYLDDVTGFKSVTVNKRDSNYGLSKSIIQGVTEVLEKYERAIILEDDLETSQAFLSYMNKALDIYQDEDEVISIHGYNYPIAKPLAQTFFLKGADCWGWATWRRGWQFFNEDGDYLLSELRDRRLTKIFDFNGSYQYTRMLEDQVKGKNDSWAIRWYASAFLNDKLTLYPGKSYVRNIGFDSSGIHCGEQDPDKYNLNNLNMETDIVPIPIKDNKRAFRLITKYFNSHKRTRLWKVLRRGKKLIKLCIPPILLRILRKREESSGVYKETYRTWEEAEKATTGYDSENIASKCFNSVKMVKQGQFPYERDSVVFNDIEYSWPLLTTLLKAAVEGKGSLNVLDFGGSFGSTFYQNIRMLDSIEVTWSIVEQELFINTAKGSELEEDLNFYYTIEDCMNDNHPNVLLLSSVLPYLKDLYSWIQKFISLEIPYVIIDRTVVNLQGDDILSIQEVPKEIYEASYPLWIINEKKLLEKFQDKYRLIINDKSYTNSASGYDYIDEKCYVFKLKENA